MTARIFIVRHANTFDPGDVVRRVGGRTDLPLSRSGREQAERLGLHFAALEVSFVTASAAPLRRTRETAGAVLARQPAPPDLDVRAFLREIDHGPDEDQPEEIVLQRLGEGALMAWERDMEPPPGWLVDPDAVIGNWQALFSELGEQAGDHLVVTSNGIARFALRAAGHPIWLNAKLATAAYGLIRIDAGRTHVEEWNTKAGR